jgi:hypothetical protein
LKPFQHCLNFVHRLLNYKDGLSCSIRSFRNPSWTLNTSTDYSSTLYPYFSLSMNHDRRSLGNNNDDCSSHYITRLRRTVTAGRPTESLETSSKIIVDRQKFPLRTKSIGSMAGRGHQKCRQNTKAVYPGLE